MSIKKSMLSLILIGVMFMLCSVAVAQEEAVNEDYGFIVSITESSIIIEKWDYDVDTGEEILEEVTYEISPDIEIENAGSLAEIDEGQDVDVKYINDGEVKKAKYIYVYKDNLEEPEEAVEEE